MKVLLDTCVISETTRPGGSQRVRDHVSALQGQNVFLSVITIGEIANDIAHLKPGRKKDALASFLLDLEQDFGIRILDIDTETARIWGETAAGARKRGKVIPATDGLIAATALRHGLHVMTRNVSDFEETGVLLINPWENE